MQRKEKFGKGMRPKRCSCGGNHSLKRAGQKKRKHIQGRECNNEKFAEKEKQDQKKVWKGKEKSVSCTAGVMNATSENETKTDPDDC